MGGELLGVPVCRRRPRPRQHVVERSRDRERAGSTRTGPDARRWPRRREDAGGSAMRPLGDCARAQARQRCAQREQAGRRRDRPDHLHLGHVGRAEGRRPVASRRAGPPADDAARHAQAPASGGRIGARRHPAHRTAVSRRRDADPAARRDRRRHAGPLARQVRSRRRARPDRAPQGQSLERGSDHGVAAAGPSGRTAQGFEQPEVDQHRRCTGARRADAAHPHGAAERQSADFRPAMA